MSHWAEIDNTNTVISVLVGNNNDSNGDEGYQWLIDNLGGTWIKTSYNTFQGVHLQGGTPLHKNYAGIGYLFDGVGFYAPQPYPSWTKNADTYLWEAPVAHPTDDKRYTWDEETLSWLEITE